MIVGFYAIKVPVLFDWSSDKDPVKLLAEQTGEKCTPYNKIWFGHVLFIPLVPVWIGQPLWKIDGEYYVRKLSTMGEFVNIVFSFPGILLVVAVASTFSQNGWRVR